MWFAKRLHSVAAKLALIYAAFFSVSVIALGLTCIGLVDSAFRRQMDQRISVETASLLSINAKDGLTELAKAIRQRTAPSGAFTYRLDMIGGAHLAGGLEHAASAEGWSNVGVQSDDAEGEAPDAFRAFSVKTQSAMLTVALDTDALEDLRSALNGAFTSGILLAGALAAFGGMWLGRVFLKRFNTLGQTADLIAGGAWAQRMPVSAGNDEFDRLSAALNRMLERHSAFMETQKQITSDIAHDIRTPLARLRQRLESLQKSDGGMQLEGAIGETDNLLAILSSLLRIAEIEEGSRKAGFAQADLGALAADVTEAFSAAFEEQNKHLTLRCDKNMRVRGDREMLTQLLANLVENALAHTPPGSRTQVSVRRQETGVLLAVRDDGPGIADGDLQHVLKRFYRQDKSRATPGNGLGLSLAQAIAKLHDTELVLRNCSPGLEAAVFFPGASKT